MKLPAPMTKEQLEAKAENENRVQENVDWRRVLEDRDYVRAVCSGSGNGTRNMSGSAPTANDDEPGAWPHPPAKTRRPNIL